jgi:hypothetical protein
MLMFMLVVSAWLLLALQVLWLLTAVTTTTGVHQQLQDNDHLQLQKLRQQLHSLPTSNDKPTLDSFVILAGSSPQVRGGAPAAPKNKRAVPTKTTSKKTTTPVTLDSYVTAAVGSSLEARGGAPAAHKHKKAIPTKTTSVTTTDVIAGSSALFQARGAPAASKNKQNVPTKTTSKKTTKNNKKAIVPTKTKTSSKKTTTTNVNVPYVPISVIIPATASRLSQINKLLESIAVGTRLPQEIVVAVSADESLQDISPFVGVHQLAGGGPNNHIKNMNASSSSLPLFQELTIPHTLNVTIVVSPGGTKLASGNRNVAAEHATLPLLAAVDSDDIVGYDWLQTVFAVFDNSQIAAIDALLHKWFPCRAPAKKPQSGRDGFLPHERTWSMLHDPTAIYIANDHFPTNLQTDAEALQWVAQPVEVNVVEPLHSDPGFNHPWWTLGHIAVKRDVYLKVKQREDVQSGEDAMFVADLMTRGYRVGSIRNRLTGYCKH